MICAWMLASVVTGEFPPLAPSDAAPTSAAAPLVAGAYAPGGYAEGGAVYDAGAGHSVSVG